MSFSDVVVLFGGASSERRVSVASAQHVLSVLGDAHGWFEAPDGRVWACDPAEVAAFAKPFENDFRPRGAPRWESLAAALDAPEAASRVFFLGYHGTGGEDGTVQRLLEGRSLAYTGSGARASADAFDKRAAKRLVERAGVRCAAEAALPLGELQATAVALNALVSRHGRVVAKPVAGGSSVGLFHLRGAADVGAAAAAIAASGEAYLAEEFIDGTELTVGVVEGMEGLRALPCSEVRLEAGRAFDFEGKYLGKGTTELTPAHVPPEVSRAAQELALTAHAAIGCEGYSRTDVIATASGPVFLETNTLPGLTRASFIPQQLAAEGSTMLDFLAGQVALARRRQKRAAS